jgi:tetratricopeptide (TPR) repeat protein
MNLIKVLFGYFTILIVSSFVFAQDIGKPAKTNPTPTPKPPITTAPTPKLSETLAKNLGNLRKDEPVSRERREQALTKLLEGQRYIWRLTRRQQGGANSAKLAQQALQQAVELDPTLAEGYTALAELAISTPPYDVDEGIRLAAIAVKTDKNNYGGHKILARLYTIKSKFNTETLDAGFAEKAIEEWKELTRLDPRNAEAWAFLSEYYARQNKQAERIEALRKWLGAAQPLEMQFYRRMNGNRANLSPETANLKLGEALLDAGNNAEALEILTQSVADAPDNSDAIELLSKAIEKSGGVANEQTIQTLQQAIYANPENISLILLLAKVQARAGKTAETAKFLNETIAKLSQTNKVAASNLQIALGEIYLENQRYDEAVAEYKKSFTTRGIDLNNLANDEEREVAIEIYQRIINAYKTANRYEDAKNAIIGSQKILGEEDSFVDRQLIALYRENGKREEALKAVRYARLRFPEDEDFLRTEALVLTELGRVDEGVAIIKSQIGKANKNENSLFNDYQKFLFISYLYTEARRGKEAIEAANKAIEISKNEQERINAQLTLASAQNSAGDFKAAESTLRAILKAAANNPGIASIAANNLGYFLVERNERLEEALQLIQQAVDYLPDNPNYLDSLGWAYYKLGKFELAEEYLQKALKFDPTSATILDHLGDVYQKRGKIEIARQMWQKALTLSTDADQITKIKAKLAKK